MRAIYRYLIPVLVAVIALTSVSLVGCSQSQEPDTTLLQDKPSWTEKQVIEYLYVYLMDKAGKVQGVSAEAEKLSIAWEFRNAVIASFTETVKEDDVRKWGDPVEIELTQPGGTLPGLERIPTYTSGLRKLAEYSGNSWWGVSIAGQWRVNERTRDVVALNDEATKHLEKISHNTYQNYVYKYHIDYPADWTLKQIGDDGKVLIVAPEPQVDIAIDEPRKLPTGQSLGQYVSGFAAFFPTVYQDFMLVSLAKLENGDYQMEYEWVLGGTRIYSRTYFVLHNNWFYIIGCSAPKSTYESYRNEFDYAYNSFGFD